MIRLFVSVFAVLLGGMGVFSTGMAMRHAPAFVQGLRDEGLDGVTRTEDPGAMYTQSDYLIQIGAGLVNVDASPLATIEPPDKIEPAEVEIRDAVRGELLLRRAVSYDPSNAHAWFVYAQALAIRGEPASAFAALDRSRALSPTMPYLAYQRSWVSWDLLQEIEKTAIEVPEVSRYREIYAADRERAQTAVPEENLPPPLDAMSANFPDTPARAAKKGEGHGAKLVTPALQIFSESENTAEDLYRFALNAADPEVAAIAFAHAALRGHARSAYYLGQLYETAAGVPLNLHLARAWYNDAALPEAEYQLDKIAETETPAALSPPRLLSAVRTDDGALELVWTPGAASGASFRVELFAEDGTTLVTRDVLLSALRLDAPPGVAAWRVTALQDDARAASEPQKISPDTLE